MAVYIEKYNDLIHEMSEVVWFWPFELFAVLQVLNIVQCVPKLL